MVVVDLLLKGGMLNEELGGVRSLSQGMKINGAMFVLGFIEFGLACVI